MVNIPRLEGFASFAEWLTNVATTFPSKAALATHLGTTPQLLQKWLKTTIPRDRQLDEIAGRLGVDSSSLKLLAHGLMPAKAEAGAENRGTRTEMGAIVGRKWEELKAVDPSAADGLLTVLEAPVTLHRPSYQEYARQQREIAARRTTKQKATGHA